MQNVTCWDCGGKSRYQRANNTMMRNVNPHRHAACRSKKSTPPVDNSVGNFFSNELTVLIYKDNLEIFSPRLSISLFKIKRLPIVPFS